MDELSHHKKHRLNEQDDDSKSLEIASNLIESGNSTRLSEMLTNKVLSEISMENGVGKRLLMIASEVGQLGCLRVLLDHLETSSTELVAVKGASDYQSCGTAYMTRGKHRFLKVNSPPETENISDFARYYGLDPRTKPLVLVACHRRYHHYSERYYKDYEVAEIEPGAVMSKYIYVDISNLLIEACKKSDIEQVEYLLSMGADVNRVDYRGRNAVVLACVSNDVKLMEVLLKHGADPNTRIPRVLGDSNHEGDMSSVDSAEEVGDEGIYGDHLVIDGDPIVREAVSAGPAMMRLLLEHGADLFAMDSDGHDSPFLLAYECNNEPVVDVIIDYAFRKPFSEIESYGQYPLHIACANVDYPLIERMLQKGADVNAVDGDTPLHRVLHTAYRMKGSKHEPPDLTRCVKLLLDYGADVTFRDSEGKTVFEYVEPGSDLDVLLREDRKPVLK